MKQWYYGRADQQSGPVDEFTLRGKIAAGEVTADSLVWCDGMGDWQPLADVPDLQQPLADGIYAPPGTSPSPGLGGYTMGYQPPTCGLAIASMVCGISAVVMLMCYGLGALVGIPAVICGHMAMRKIREAPYAMAGRGMAIAGLITGYSAMALMLVGVIFFIVLISQNFGSF